MPDQQDWIAAQQRRMQPPPGGSANEREVRRNRAFYTNTDMTKADIAKDALMSAASGARSGVESAAGLGDISTLQQDAASWLMRKMGLGDTAANIAKTATKYTSPLSLLPTSEDIGAVTDRLFGRDAVTRHQPQTPIGEDVNAAANVASGLVGGPEDLLKVAATSAPLKAAAIGAFGVKPQAVEALSGFKPWKSETGIFKAAEGTPDVPQFNLERYAPARGTPERVQELVSSPDVRDVLAQYIQRGKGLGGQFWYNADPLAQEWMKVHGPEEGRRLFNQNIDLTGATSAQSDVEANVRSASYYQQRHMAGMPPATADVPNPSPYGHFAQKTHKPIVERMLQPGAEWDPVQHDKMAGYTSGLKGNETPVAVDLHATRLPAMITGDPRYLLSSFKPDKNVAPINPRQMVESGKVSMEDALKTPVWWMDQPTKAEYPALERFWQEMGHDTGMTPAQAQASAWIGGHSTTGGKSFDERKGQLAMPFVGIYDKVLARTARQMDMDPRDVLSGIISGRIPLR